MTELSPEQKRVLREEVFVTRPMTVCEDCGGFHLRACRRVKRQVFVGQGAGAGTRVEVEYFDSWDESETIYPEDVFDEDAPYE